MKLKYKVEKDGDDTIVSLVNSSLKITPNMMDDVQRLNLAKTFDGNEKLAIESAKNEIHWRLTNKNMGLHDFMRILLNSLGDARGMGDIELKNAKIREAMEKIQSFFNDDSRSIY
jgi:hypothetical protein